MQLNIYTDATVYSAYLWIGGVGCTLSLVLMLLFMALDKRRLINHLIAVENPDNFTAFTNTNIISEDYQSSQLLDKVTDIFHQHSLFINDYGLNNMIMHLIVMIDRIKKGKHL